MYNNDSGKATEHKILPFRKGKPFPISPKSRQNKRRRAANSVIYTLLATLLSAGGLQIFELSTKII
jgi:hypothetical protein